MHKAILLLKTDEKLTKVMVKKLDNLTSNQVSK